MRVAPQRPHHHRRQHHVQTHAVLLPDAAHAASELAATHDVLLHHAQSSLADLAEAAAAASSSSTSSNNGGFLAPLTDTLEAVLKAIQAQLDRLHVPYSYGYSIILLTAAVKLLTLPLTKIQVRVGEGVLSAAFSR